MDFIDHRSTAKFIFKTSSTDEKARIDDSGNILTGKTSSNFSTAGAEVRNVGNIWATRDGGTPLALNRLSSEGTIAQFYKDGSSLGVIASVSSDFVIYSTISGHTGLRFGDGWIGSTNNAGTLQNGTVSLGTTAYKFADLYLSGNANIGGNATITGDLTVNGTTTTLNTATLDVEDKNITLNYGAGDTSSTADGAGITIQDAVDASNNATILWDATNDEFDFSHAINVAGDITVSGTVDGRDVATDGLKLDGIEASADVTDTTNVTAAGALMDSEVTNLDQVKAFDSSDYATAAQGSTADSALQNVVEDTTPQLGGDLDLNGNDITGTGNLDVAGTITADNNLTIQNSSAYGSIELGGVSGGFIDIKRPFSDDYDLRLLAEGDGGVINVASGELTIQRAGSAKLATTSTGIDVTGVITTDGMTVDGATAFNSTATFSDGSEARFGNDNDMALFHSGGTSHLRVNSGIFKLRADDMRFTAQNGTSERLRVSSTGIDVTGTATMDGLDVQGNVIINNSYAYQIGGDSASTSVIGKMHNSSGVFTLASLDSRHMKLTTSNADRLKVDANGDISFYDSAGSSQSLFWDASTKFLGLGSTAPAAKLDIVDTSADVQMRVYKNDGTKNTRITLTADDSGAKIHYRDADNAGALRFNNNLGEVMRIPADTTRLGIGTSSPSARLDVQQATAGNIVSAEFDNTDYTANNRNAIKIRQQVSSSGSYSAYVGSDKNTGNLFLANDSITANHLVINPSGNVGINSSIPAAMLDVVKTGAGIQDTLQLRNAQTLAAGVGSSLGFGDSGGARLAYIAGAATGANNDNGYLSFYTRASDSLAERMRITASGDVEVKGGNELKVYRGDNATYGSMKYLTGSGGLQFNDQNSDGISFVRGGSTESMRLDSSGQLLLGRGANVASGAEATRIQFYNTNSTYDIASIRSLVGAGQVNRGELSFAVNNGAGQQERIRLDYSGNLMVGKTDTSIATQGVFFGPNYSHITSTNDTPLALSRKSSDGTVLDIRKDGANVGSVGTKLSDGGTSDGELFITSGNTGLFFDDIGSYIRPCNGSAALRDNTVDLGKSDSRFKDLYLSGTAYVATSIGIGTASPVYPLDLRNPSDSNQVLRVLFPDAATVQIGTSRMASGATQGLFVEGQTGVRFGVSGTEYGRFHSNGNFGLGTSSPSNKLSIKGTVGFEATNSTNKWLAYTYTDNTLRLNYNGSGADEITIDSIGNLLVGQTSNSETGTGIGLVPDGTSHMYSGSTDTLMLGRGGTDGEILSFNKSGTTVGSIGSDSGVTIYMDGGGARAGIYMSGSGVLPRYNGALADNATDLGASNRRFKNLYLSGGIKLNTASTADTIAMTRGTNGQNNMLKFVTGSTDDWIVGQRNDGTSDFRFYSYGTSSDAVSITRTGNLGIGTSSPSDKLTLDSGQMRLSDNYGIRWGSASTAIYGSGGAGTLQMYTNSAERTRIDASGNQLWGKTSANNTTQGIRFLGSSGFMSIVRSNATAIIVNRIDGDGTLMEFRTSGTTRGSISISGSTTSYNTTSDQRAKENIVDAPSASDDIDAIKVRSFDFKADGSHQKYGMVAQELSTVAPEAVSVPDDAEEMQSVDYSKLVPMMLKEIQTLRARVAQLEGEN